MVQRICDLCGKSWEYQNKIVYDTDNKRCYHDNEFAGVIYDLDYQKKGREKHAKDIVQPYLSNGKINPTFQKLYPKSEFVTRKIENS